MPKAHNDQAEQQQDSPLSFVQGKTSNTTRPTNFPSPLAGVSLLCISEEAGSGAEDKTVQSSDNDHDVDLTSKQLAMCEILNPTSPVQYQIARGSTHHQLSPVSSLIGHFSIEKYTTDAIFDLIRQTNLSMEESLLAIALCTRGHLLEAHTALAQIKEESKLILVQCKSELVNRNMSLPEINSRAETSINQISQKAYMALKTAERRGQAHMIIIAQAASVHELLNGLSETEC